MSSRMTFARIVFSPPKPSAEYRESSLVSVKGEDRAIHWRTYVRHTAPVNRLAPSTPRVMLDT